MKPFRHTLSTALAFLAANVALAGPVAHYTFDDSNDRYKDVTGNGYNGAAAGSGTTFVPSGITGLGDAMDSTTSGRVLVNTPITEVSLSNFAISFWATTGTAWDDWMSFSSPLLTLMNVGSTIFLNNARNPSLTGYTDWQLASDALIGGLNHIVLSADSTTETAFLYINGTLADTSAWTVASGVTLGLLTIGGAGDTTIRDIDATIDDVQIYDTALSSGDVSLLYNSPGTVIPEPATMGLVALVSAVGLFIRRRFID